MYRFSVCVHNKCSLLTLIDLRPCISDLQEQLTALEEENKSLLSVIEEANRTIQTLQDELDESNEKVDALTDQLITNVSGLNAINQTVGR